jgi:hypothetical protein
MAGRSHLQGTRAHLGVETQRQYSGEAILRTTPVLLGLFSIVTLCPHEYASGLFPIDEYPIALSAVGWNLARRRRRSPERSPTITCSTAMPGAGAAYPIKLQAISRWRRSWHITRVVVR